MGAVNPIESLNGATGPGHSIQTLLDAAATFYANPSSGFSHGKSDKKSQRSDCVSQTLYLNLNPYFCREKVVLADVRIL